MRLMCNPTRDLLTDTQRDALTDRCYASKYLLTHPHCIITAATGEPLTPEPNREFEIVANTNSNATAS